MKYRQLGKTDIQVSVIALGCWPFAGDANWGQQSDEDSIATVHAALDEGINLFDTAEGYGAGKSEEVLGRGLKGRRDEAIIATKVSPNHLAPDDIIKACEDSLRYLGTDYIDLYQIHWPNHSIPIEDSLGALETLRDQGKIRAIGVCNFGPQDLRGLWEAGHAETDQLPYGLLWRMIEHEIQPMCVEQGMGILCYSPLGQGLLTGKFESPDDVPEGRARTRHFSKERPGARHGEEGCEEEVFAAIDRIREICDDIGEPMTDVSLAWALQRPGVTSVLAGARRPEQIRQNARAAELALSDDVMERLTQATEEVKRELGTNPDPYQGSGDSRYR